MYNTIFTIKDPMGIGDYSDQMDYSEEGVGQATCLAILNKFKNSIIILKGFLNTATNSFIKAQI